MRLTVRDSIMPLVEEEALGLIRQYPEQAEVINNAVVEFRILYGERVFADIPQLLTFCTDIDQMPAVRDLPAALSEPISDCRHSIIGQIAREYVRRHRPTVGDIDPPKKKKKGKGKKRGGGG